MVAFNLSGNATALKCTTEEISVFDNTSLLLRESYPPAEPTSQIRVVDAGRLADIHTAE